MFNLIPRMNYLAETEEIVETESMTEREIAEERLRKTIRELQRTLEYEIEYCQAIKYCLDQNPSAFLGDVYSNDMDDNLDYLIRDLVPEWQNQADAIDTLVNALKTIQQYRKKIIQ